MTPDEARAKLEAAGDRLEAADRKRDAAMAELTSLAREVQGVVPIRQIAILGKVSRQTVYKMLKGA